jgi:hypothetical protein
MKTKLQLFAVFVIAALATLFAQGPLTPPGGPAPTMKSLDQIEARTPISSAPFTISQSGSYYLTTNISVTSGTAITITASNVTLDLNGFKISSTAFGGGTGSGILIQSAKNVAISNGQIEGREVFDNAFLHGINSSSSLINVRVTDVSVFGCGLNGINLGDQSSSVVERCTVDLVGAEGIRAGVVSNSTATRCGGAALVARSASHCYGQSTTSYGLFVLVAENCVGESTSGTGIYVLYGANNCRGFSVSGSGVVAVNAANCWGVSNGNGVGLDARVANNCFASSASGTGLSVTIAIGCIGQSNTGTGINAYIANSCNGTSINATYKYNMP